MKKIAMFLFVLAAFQAHAVDNYVCTISSTSPTSSSSCLDLKNGSVAIALTRGGDYSMQCDGDAYVSFGTTSATATDDDLLLKEDSLYDVTFASIESKIAVLAVTGTVACDVMQVSRKN